MSRLLYVGRWFARPGLKLTFRFARPSNRNRTVDIASGNGSDHPSEDNPFEANSSRLSDAVQSFLR